MSPVSPIISINIDRRIQSFLALKTHVEKIKPIAILIQDVPHMKREEFDANCHHVAEGYKVFTCEEESGSTSKRAKVKPENMILVHRDIEAEKLQIPGQQDVQYKTFRSTVLGVKLVLATGRNIPLVERMLVTYMLLCIRCPRV